MYENSAANVREYTRLWEKGARMATQTEVEQAMLAWRPQRTVGHTARYRAALAKALVALAARLAPPQDARGATSVVGQATGS